LPRPRKRARSVSCEIALTLATPAPGTAMLCTAISWNIQCVGSSGERGRRVHSTAAGRSRISVCTNSLLNAGCSASAIALASTTSV